MIAASFLWYVCHGILCSIAAAIILSPIALIWWLGRMYWKRLHKDPVHIDPWCIFEKDLAVVGKLVATIISFMLIFFILGYIDCMIDKKINDSRSSKNPKVIDTSSQQQ